MQLRTDSGGFQGVVERAAAGDNDAFAQLVEPLIPKLRGYLRGVGREETDDLLDDVLLSVFSHLGQFRGDETSFRSWVFTIAHHEGVDHHRRRARRPEPIDPSTCEPAPPRSYTTAESLALDRVAEAEMLEVLASLPAPQRQALLLRTVADLSVQQTADVMGRSVGAVKLLQHRAVASLRRRIEGANDGS